MMDEQTLIEFIRLSIACGGGFVLGAAWIVWETRQWDEPRQSSDRDGIRTTGSGDRPPPPRR